MKTLDLRGVVRPVPVNVLDLRSGAVLTYWNMQATINKILKYQKENFIDLDAPVVKNGRAL